jgi:hypothetical protein
MFVSLIEFIVFVLVFPAFLMFAVMVFLDEVIGMLFEVHLLAWAVGLAAMGWALSASSTAIIQTVARIQIDGIPFPVILLLLSAACLISSFVAAVILNKNWGEPQ